MMQVRSLSKAWAPSRIRALLAGLFVVLGSSPLLAGAALLIGGGILVYAVGKVVGNPQARGAISGGARSAYGAVRGAAGRVIEYVS